MYLCNNSQLHLPCHDSHCHPHQWTLSSGGQRHKQLIIFLSNIISVSQYLTLHRLVISMPTLSSLTWSVYPGDLQSWALIGQISLMLLSDWAVLQSRIQVCAAVLQITILESSVPSSTLLHADSADTPQHAAVSTQGFALMNNNRFVKTLNQRNEPV